MLPINETIKIGGVKYKVYSLGADRYSIEGGGLNFTLTKDQVWQAPENVSKILSFKLGKQIDELIWFRSMGV